MGVKKSISKACEKASGLPVIGGIFKPKPKIAIVRLSGVIADSSMKRGALSYSKFSGILERAFDLHKLQAVALAINSPGGSPAQSALIGQTIRRLAEEKKVPVYAFVEDVAASGGYWLACAADEIYAQDSSIVGSIGVISASFGFKNVIEKYGIERRVHTSGKDKGFLDPFQSEKPGDVKRLKEIQTDVHDQFKDWVRERRGEKLKGADKDIFEGQFWTAGPALDHGLIDGTDELHNFCKGKFGKTIKFVTFGPEKSFLAGLLGGGNASLTHMNGSRSVAQDIADIIEDRSVWARYGL